MTVRGVTEEDIIERRTKLIWHEAPVDRSRAAIECWTYLDDSYGVGWEKLFLSRISETEWRVESIPFFTFGLKLHSIVLVDYAQRIVEIVETPEDPSFRLSFVDEKKARMAWTSVQETKYAIGGEWVSETTFAVQMSPEGKQAIETLITVWDTLEFMVGWEDLCERPFEPGPEQGGFPASGDPAHQQPREWHPEPEDEECH
jgi:hypothetical protein